ncbi:MAG: tRNA (adenosine(37)-N6)-dimethylallyltransferase MiaA [Thermomicrobiales bacterium]|nr:MAG: tRNA (adenosine(37)-N6)-dimethylallyltransferase MiaA [Thermomicrobiales bacterium]
MESSNRSSLIVICGATATGKTALSIALSQRFDGEVINADSRYFYRGMDIGVAKPTMAERNGVPHHLIDILDLDDPEGMTLAVYQELALGAIDDVLDRGKTPFLTGGTPLYINAVVENWRIPRVAPDPAFRAQLEEEIDRHGLDLVVERLRSIDPVAAERSAQNPRRVIRALEIYAATGKPMSELEGKDPPRYRALELGLSMSRERLYRVIDNRVDEQMAQGLEHEVRALLESGVPRSNPAFSALGYRQLFPVIDDEMPLEEAVQTIKHDTHRYVRHQETWLRKNPRIVWLNVTQDGWEREAVEAIEAFLSGESAGTLF